MGLEVENGGFCYVVGYVIHPRLGKFSPKLGKLFPRIRKFSPKLGRLFPKLR
jgi:hypothetical protein